jgi:hypothetical protein
MKDLEKYTNLVEKTEYYKKVKKLVKIFEDSGMVYRSYGHCMGVSDLSQKLLSEFGVESELVECTLSVIFRDPFSEPRFLGHDTKNVIPDHLVETHIVCITKTEIPILIDLSIGFIDKKVNYLVFPIVDDLITNADNILTLDMGHSIWTYNRKVHTSFPEFHEKSILKRIETDTKITKKINLINRFLICIGIITSLNFLRGTYDFYQKYINKTNDFGPSTHKIDKTEKNKYK